jgi:sulfotransferase
MSNKKLLYLAGLPRSGSTLFSALLSQNPDIHAPGNSPVPQLLYNTSHAFMLAAEQITANGRTGIDKEILSSIVQTYYNNTDKPIVLDKCREWTQYAHLITKYIDPNPKIVVLVRPIDQIMVSFRDIFAKNKRFFDPSQFLVPSSPPLMIAIKGLMAAINSKSDRYLYVSYKSLVEDTDHVLDRVYDFFDLPRFGHDLNHVNPETVETDHVYDLQGLHAVRPIVGYRTTTTKLDSITQMHCDRMTDMIFNNKDITIL